MKKFRYLTSALALSLMLVGTGTINTYAAEKEPSSDNSPVGEVSQGDENKADSSDETASADGGDESENVGESDESVSASEESETVTVEEAAPEATQTPDENTETAEPDAKQYVIMVNYLDLSDGTVLHDAAVNSYDEGTVYEIDSPVIDGYTLQDASMSSISGTADSDKTIPVYYLRNQAESEYSVTVNYLESGTDKQLQAAVRKVCEKGEKYQISSPSIGGYSLVDPAQSVISGTAEGDNHDLVFNVYYSAVKVSYTIKYVTGDGTGAYIEKDSEVDYASAGETVVITPDPDKYTGYSLRDSDKSLSLTVSADGNSVLSVHYDQEHSSIYFATEGSKIDPVTGAPGTSFTMPADPTRSGYVFVGWDWNGDGTYDPSTDIQPTVLPEKPLIVNAIWKEGTADYTYVYWLMDLDDNSRYNYQESVAAKGNVGEKTEAPQDKHSEDLSSPYKWYELNQDKTDQPKTIQADGSTVINVYYDLVTVEVGVRVTSDVSTQVASITCRYGNYVNFDSTDPATGKSYREEVMAQYSSNIHFFGWQKAGRYASTSPIQRVINDEFYIVKDKDGKYSTYVFLRVTPREVRGRYRYYYCFPSKEAADEAIRANNFGVPSEDMIAHEIAVDEDGYVQGALPGCTQYKRRRSSTYYDGDPDTLKDVVFGDWENDNPGYLTTYFKTNLFEHVFIYNQYDVDYYSGENVVKTVQHYYTETFDPNKDISADALTAPDEYHVFAGWYDNPDCKGEPVTSATMPIGKKAFYAKWVLKTINIDYDLAGGSLSDQSQASLLHQTIDINTVPAKTADPVRKGYTFVYWYYTPAQNSDVAGANVMKAAPASNSSQTDVYMFYPLDESVTLHAAWRPDDTEVSYTVEDYLVDLDDPQKKTQVDRDDTKDLSGTVGTSVTVAAGKFDGYPYPNISSQAIVLSADASQNVIRFYYYKDTKYHFTVHFVDQATGSSLAADVQVNSDEQRVQVSAIGISGYNVVSGNTGYVSSRFPEYTFFYAKKEKPKTSTSTSTSVSLPSASGDSVRKLIPSTGASGTHN